jgi:hypothetical protein
VSIAALISCTVFMAGKIALPVGANKTVPSLEMLCRRRQTE